MGSSWLLLPVVDLLVAVAVAVDVDVEEALAVVGRKIQIEGKIQVPLDVP